MQLTNSSGTVTKTYNYDAFGVEKNPDSNDANPFRYCGEYFDVETGTYYLRARYYNPTVGRFLSEDPIRDGLNWYTYCYNNPVLFIDPSGYTAYVFYDNNVFGNNTGGKYAKSIKTALEGIYNTDVKLISAMTVNDFISEWNNMDDSTAIEAVVLLYHGSANTLQLKKDSNERLYDGGSDGRFQELNGKSIDSLIILGCNTAGNPTRSDSPYNIATSFSNINGVRVALGSDGSVRHTYNSFTKKYTVKSITSEYWKSYKDPGATTNRGFIVFANGQEVQTLSSKRYSISDLITTVGNTSETGSGGGRRI